MYNEDFFSTSMTDRIDYRDAITSENLVLVTSCVHKTKMHTQEKCVSVKRYSISTNPRVCHPPPVIDRQDNASEKFHRDCDKLQFT